MKHQSDNKDKKTDCRGKVSCDVYHVIHTARSEYSEVEMWRHLVDHEATVQENKIQTLA